LALIKYEYTMLKQLALLDLPIPEFSDVPIFEGTDIRGYRMEELYKLGGDEMHRRSEDIRQAVTRWHDAGYSHGDLSMSNIMENEAGLAFAKPAKPCR
jgi:tRNA A-37 threonylcarbamoyl transferase component Bud32